MKERPDDYAKRKAHLKNMSDKELKDYFYQLTDKLVEDLVDLGKRYTSKSIERSVLLRMGFSSIQADEIVDVLSDNDLLRKGAGHCVFKVSNHTQKEIVESGKAIAQGEYIDFLLKEFDIHEKT